MDELLPLTRLVERFDSRWLSYFREFLTVDPNESLPSEQFRAMRLLLDIALQTVDVTQLVFDDDVKSIGGLSDVEHLLEEKLERCMKLEYACIQRELANR